MFPPESAAICWAAVARWVGVHTLGGASTRYLQCEYALETINLPAGHDCCPICIQAALDQAASTLAAACQAGLAAAQQVVRWAGMQH